MFKQAIELDPNYALAYADMANAYRHYARGNERPRKEIMPLARAAATKAMEIDESLWQAHESLAWILIFYDWDWAGAEREVQRAIELDPNVAPPHIAYASLLTILGRHEEALLEVARAREINPVFYLARSTAAAAHLFWAGRLDEARERLQKTIELDPEYWFSHFVFREGLSAGREISGGLR